jgi:SAM-dependent MidA family methyltransferase
MEKQNGALKTLLSSQIREKGPMPFSRFMEQCLYHPLYGYYRNERSRIGAGGDYYSSPSVHPLFGCSVARQLRQMADILDESDFHVIEMGAGRGFLGKDILDWAEEHAPHFYGRMQYHIVEYNPLPAGEVPGPLSRHHTKGKVSWIEPRLFEAGQRRFRGCFLSNELVDAFPVHRVCMQDGRLREIYVTEQNGRFAEVWGELSDARLSTHFGSLGVTLAEGQQAEANLRAIDWMETVASALDKGFVLTIDYGYLADELYAAHRREGTLLCYQQHRTSEDPYDRIGEQDITSHVDFSSLIRTGGRAGLAFTGLVCQSRFLIALGVLQEMESLGRNMASIDALKLRLSLKHLIEPEAGMGEAFKVLIQHKEIGGFDLDGLRELDSIPWPVD